MPHQRLNRHPLVDRLGDGANRHPDPMYVQALKWRDRLAPIDESSYRLL
jgi:hypothetical protein